ncbi:DnaD domain-containing protein [Pontibacillus sp. HN14]|uniref:DnaD domain-containing protein n=2 Tax=Bacillaceae TaxID=186817 RepID=A0ABY8V322_9BACI|nr:MULTISPECIES: DnaD domain-containing protein [Pontibacillus]MCD5322958.1 DnaD domain-containing protein [Pontibacillus sp. HN14]WIG00193.1 DnaD domain-containing protein [Pontibacillus chungwhensis]
MNGIATLMKDQLALPKRLLTNYRQLGLTESDVMVLLHIHRFQSEGNDFPTPSELSDFLSINEYECSQVLRKLIQKGYLSIEQSTDEQVLNEVYSLYGLWESLVEEQGEAYRTQNEEPEQPNMFVLFEQEFGRALSPFEIETINIWIDEDAQEPALIKAALREAVLMGKLNFKYIDRILREWKKKGIRSVQDAREASKSFRGQQSKQNQNSEQNNQQRDVSIYYNWLDDDA